MKTQNDVSTLCCSSCTLYAQLFYDVIGFTQTGSISQADRKAVDEDVGLEDVARGSGNAGDDGGVALYKRIEQGRFAGVGRAGDYDLETIADDFAAFATGQVIADLRRELTHIVPDAI